MHFPPFLATFKLSFFSDQLPILSNECLFVKCIEDDDERAVGYMASYISHRGSDELKAGLQMVYPALREDNNGAVQEDLKNKTGEASDHAQVKVCLAPLAFSYVIS